MFFDALRHKLGAHSAQHRALGLMLFHIWWYLRRCLSRIERLLAHYHAGTLPKPRTAPHAPPQVRPAERITVPAPAPRVRMPHRHAWLIRLVQPTAQVAGHLDVILAMPEMIALLAAAPQLGRVLRPLYRMLGVSLPEILRLPPRPPRRRVPRPARATPTSPPVSARERRSWLSYSPGRIGDSHRRTPPTPRKIAP